MFTVVGEYGEPGEAKNQSLNRRIKKYLGEAAPVFVPVLTGNFRLW